MPGSAHVIAFSRHFLLSSHDVKPFALAATAAWVSRDHFQHVRSRAATQGEFTDRRA
jgi:hypothetical protein